MSQEGIRTMGDERSFTGTRLTGTKRETIKSGPRD
jgi:hypothetical protein